MILIRFK